jgi:arsenate reductase
MKRILFLCTGNSARSQMAEAFLRHLAPDQWEAHSAGSDPKGIHPFTVEVMSEIGIDISQQRSKSVKEYMGRMLFDDAVILCRRYEQNCPTIYADARRVHRWLFDDPAADDSTPAEQLARFRAVRDQVKSRLELWLAETHEAELA